MNHPPAGWPRITPSLAYEDPIAAIDWLIRAFGFAVRMKVQGDDGKLHYSELTFGDDGMISVSGAGPAYADGKLHRDLRASPQSIGGRSTQSLALFVDDVDAHCAHAKAHGARIFAEPATQDYGPEYWSDRSYGALDPEGHPWWFMQRLRTGS
jgi:uncharacterized glyoxalase superfamily protein PhnB